MASVIYSLEGLEEKHIVGQGAYGVALKVQWNKTPCIAKKVHDILLGHIGDTEVSEDQMEYVRKKFQDECTILSQLKHPNIVQFLGVFHDTDGDVLLMECLHIALDTCLEKYPNISLPLKLSILQDVTCGLLYLHFLTPPIIHRDLTASNVLLTPDMKAKIADLGVSKAFDLHHKNQIENTTTPGTPAYMPPEALISNPKYDTKLDIFSFGALSLYVANQEFPSVYDFPTECDPKLITEIIEKKKIHVHRRKYWMDKMGADHPLYPVVIQCLQDLPDCRPNTKDLWKMIDVLCVKYKREWKNLLDVSGAFLCN